MEIHEAYKQKMAANLKEWSAQIKLMEAKLESSAADVRVKRSEELHELHAKQQAAAEKLQELGRASGEAWDELRKTADKIWDDLMQGVTQAHAKFK